MLTYLLFFIIVIPICILFHEIGHALGVILTSKSPVHIYLGNVSKENKENFRLGRIHFHLQWSYKGFAYWGGNLTVRQEAIALVGGPIMSFLLAGVCGIIASKQPGGNWQTIFWWTAIANFLQFIFTIIPITYPKWWGGSQEQRSDGLQLVQLLAKRKAMNE